MQERPERLHLAMRGAPAGAIQELAEHQDLGTTQRYMHLSTAALDAAIRLLETGSKPAARPWRNSGGGGNGGTEGPSSLKEIDGGGGS